MPRRLALALALVLAPAATAAAQAPPSPSEFLGLEIGADRVLADYRQIRDYFHALAAASPRVQVEALGRTTLGEEMILAVVSSETNLSNLPRLKEIARRLADPRGLSDAEADSLVREGRAILLVLCNIHADEIGSSQMAMEWAHALVTTEDPAVRRRLDEVVLLIVPSANPDGQIMEVEWYGRWLGTEYEGSEMPWLYHPYAGHDLNRDWFMLTQAETRHLNRAMYRDWLPQVVIDEHQMGRTGPRMFVPPFADPVDPDLHPLVFREIDAIGTTMALRLEQAEKPGVIYGYSYDAYWIGGTRNTPWWKNVTGLLTEIASVDLATPVHVDPSELAGNRKGLVDYAPRVNFPHPWPGGWWRLRDILDYGRIASDAALEWVAGHREDVLRGMLTRARSGIAGGAGAAYRIPAGQHDPAAARRLAELLAEHGVDVRRDAGGAHWVPLAQPYRRLVEELLEPQRYPEVHPAPGAEPFRPYDVSAWTLPLMMGVEVQRTAMPADLAPERVPPPDAAPARPAVMPFGEWVAVDRAGVDASRVANAGLAAGGAVRATGDAFWLDMAAAAAAAPAALEIGITFRTADGPPPEARPLRPVRVATYQPWTASMDEGWTRWVLEEQGFDPTPLHDAEIRAGRLRDYDALVLPDLSVAIVDSGAPRREADEVRYRRERPPEYRGGLGDEGARAVRRFVEEGGTLVAFDTSIEWVARRFNVPVANALAEAGAGAFLAPASPTRWRCSSTTPRRSRRRRRDPRPPARCWPATRTTGATSSCRGGSAARSGWSGAPRRSPCGTGAERSCSSGSGRSSAARPGPRSRSSSTPSGGRSRSDADPRVRGRALSRPERRVSRVGETPLRIRAPTVGA